MAHLSFQGCSSVGKEARIRARVVSISVAVFFVLMIQCLWFEEEGKLTTRTLPADWSLLRVSHRDGGLQIGFANVDVGKSRHRLPY